MTRSVRRAAIALTVAALATVALIVLGVRQSMQKSCEVCVSFQGRSACRTGVGANQGEAMRTAQQNACAFLAAGMTQSIQCQNKEPDSVACE